MADFQFFNDGANEVLDSGITGSCSFALSTKTAEELGAATKAGSFSEMTGTGYARITQSAPSSSSGKKTYTTIEWKTETHTDWTTAKSVVMLFGGVAICAWNLREGGGGRDMSGANTTETFTPVLQLS